MNIDLKKLPPIETALVVLILIAAVAGVYLLQQKGDSEDRKAAAETRLTRARDDLRKLNNSKEADELKAKLDQLKANPFTDPFPTKVEASNLFPTIASKARELTVELTGLTSTSKTVAIEELDPKERPAVSYLITAKGEAEDLLGVLGLVGDVPTAVVQNLEFKRVQDRWNMILSVTVFHQLGP